MDWFKIVIKKGLLQGLMVAEPCCNDLDSSACETQANIKDINAIEPAVIRCFGGGGVVVVVVVALGRSG